MRKILLVIFVFLFLSLGQAQAAGLVPCGGPGEKACNIGCFFEMIDNILDLVIFRLAPIVAALMLAIGGVMFFFAGGSPGNLTKAKAIITSTVVGLVIIFAAFLIVGTILSMIGLAGWTQDIYKNWWQEGFFQIPGCQ
jgi:hypothetical protein